MTALKKTFLILAIFSGLGFGRFYGALHADNSDTFQAYDSDQSGTLEPSESENAKWLKGLFELKDLDSDGIITREESEGWRNDPRTKQAMQNLNGGIFNAMDGNRDGRVQLKDEWLGEPEDFAKKDKNQNGFLDRAEM